MELKRFNSKGLSYVHNMLYAAFFGEFSNKIVLDGAMDTIWNSEYVEDCGIQAQLDVTRVFDSHNELTDYLVNEVFGSVQAAREACQDAGLMTYIAMAYIDQLATPVAGGIKIGQIERYVMAEHTGSGTGRISRHMIRSPLLVKTVYDSSFDDMPNFILARSSMNSMNHLYERWLWSDNVRRNEAAMQLGNRYFWHMNALDKSIDDICDKASDLAHVIGQFFKKMDLEGITESELANLLSSEPVFEKDMKDLYPELVPA